MNLLYQTLKEPTSITQLAYGNFLGKSEIAIVLVRGSQILELWTQDLNNGKISKQIEIKTFSQIRQISSYSSMDRKKDYLIICSDSGYLVLVEFLKSDQKYEYQIIVQEMYGKTGCRRVSQGRYISTDKKGRGFLLSSIERNHLMFLNKQSDQKLELSSPIEAIFDNTICFDIQPIDVGFENPIFISLESNYGSKEDSKSTVVTGKISKQVSIYEIDLSLNNMVLKKIFKVENHFHKILTFKDKFVLIGDSAVVYDLQGNQIQKLELPQRIESLSKETENNLLTFSYFKHKKFEFWIAQNSYGDLFKISLDINLNFDYVCTTKISTHLVLLKSGYLFLINENYDHQIYSIKEFISDEQRRIENHYIPVSIDKVEGMNLIQSLQNLQGLLDMKYMDLEGDQLGQYYCLQSGVNGSKLLKLKKGVNFEQMAQSQLPINAQKIWCLGKIGEDTNQLTEMIVLGVEDSLVILQAGEQISKYKEEVKFIQNRRTLGLYELTEGNKIIGYAQITTNKIRILKGLTEFEDIEVESQNLAYCDFKDEKLVIYSQDKEILYFQWFDGNFKLIKTHKLEREVLCIQILKKNQRISNSLLVLGFTDSTLKIFSLEQENLFMQLSGIVLNSLPESIADLDNQLMVSMISGNMWMSIVDKQTGQLRDQKMYEFEGNENLKLFSIKSEKIEGVLISNKSQILYEKKQNRSIFQQMLLQTTEKMLSLSILKSKFGNDCIIYLTYNNQMKIVRKTEETEFHCESRSLQLNSRKLIIDTESLSLIVMQSQPRTKNPNEHELFTRQVKQSLEQEKEHLLDQQLILNQGEREHWQSMISVINPTTLKSIMDLKFEKENYHLVTMSICQFKEIQEENFLLVSVAQNHNIKKQSHDASMILTYQIDIKNKSFNLIHQTNLDDVCYSICQFSGRVVLGVGGYLRLYSFGKKQLLLKSEYKHKYRIINNIKVSDDRIYLTDATDSVHLLKYNEKTNQIYELADDLLPRYSVAMEILDYHSVILSDKFGNFTVQRLPQNSEKEFTEDFITYRFTWETGYLNGAPVKFDEVSRFYQVNLISQIQKVQFYRNQQQSIIYCDMDGGIHCLIPLQFQNHCDFFVHLEMLMRESFLNLNQRDHLVFRSFYGSCKGVIDFDLISQFKNLELEKQKKIAEKLDYQIDEIHNMLTMIDFKTF